MSEYKLPNPKKTSGRVMGLGLLGAVGLVVWYYLVPFLAKMAWDTVSLAVASVILGIMGYIFLSPRFWKRLNIVLQALGSMLFGAIIEMNPFVILELQLEKSEKDRKVLFDQKGKLEGQEVKLRKQLNEQEQMMSISAKKIEICREKLKNDPTDEQTGYDLESSSVDFSNSKSFIERIAPIAGDLKRLIQFADKAYTKSGYALRNARSTLQMRRAEHEAAVTGQSAMTKALRAFTGDSEMNAAADIALRKIEKDIANCVGTVRNCMAETSKIMNERDLNDAAKVALAADKVEQLRIDDKFSYVAETEKVGHLPKVSGNRWIDTLKSK